VETDRIKKQTARQNIYLKPAWCLVSYQSRFVLCKVTARSGPSVSTHRAAPPSNGRQIFESHICRDITHNAFKKRTGVLNCIQTKSTLSLMQLALHCILKTSPYQPSFTFN
jgi:hypothetical protein